MCSDVLLLLLQSQKKSFSISTLVACFEFFHFRVVKESKNIIKVTMRNLIEASNVIPCELNETWFVSNWALDTHKTENEKIS